MRYLPLLFSVLLILPGCDLAEDLPTVSTSINEPAPESVINRNASFPFQLSVRSAAPVTSLSVSMLKREDGTRIIESQLPIPEELITISGTYDEATVDTLFQLGPDVEPGEYMITIYTEIDCSPDQNCTGHANSVPVIIE